MKKTGRPETIAKLVREAIHSAGNAGASYADIRKAYPELRMKQIRHCTANNMEAGLILRCGSFRHPRFFAPGVAADVIDAVIKAEEKARKEASAVLENAQKQRLLERRKLERKAKRDENGEKPLSAKMPPWWEKLVEFVNQNPGQPLAVIKKEFGVSVAAVANAVDRLRLMGRVVSRMGTKKALVFPIGMSQEEIDVFFPPKPEKPKEKWTEPKIRRVTRSINALADKYRKDILDKRDSAPVQITGMDTAPRTIAPAPKGRFEVDEEHLSGLSKLPKGVYCEEASGWARAAINRGAK